MKPFKCPHCASRMRVDFQANISNEEKTVVKRKTKFVLPVEAKTTIEKTIRYNVRTGSKFELKIGCTKRACKFGLVARRHSKALATRDLRNSIRRIRIDVESKKELAEKEAG